MTFPMSSGGIPLSARRAKPRQAPGNPFRHMADGRGLGDYSRCGGAGGCGGGAGNSPAGSSSSAPPCFSAVGRNQRESQEPPPFWARTILP